MSTGLELAAAYSLASVFTIGAVCYICGCRDKLPITQSNTQNDNDLILVNKRLFENMREKLLIQNQPPPMYGDKDTDSLISV
jgi:hypothetical protein